MVRAMSPNAAEIRRQFLEFFERRDHRVVASSPVFPQDDPTLLFTNAGMNQFKDVFLGTGGRDYRRAVDTQKCIRVSGKHNDLEEVGVDTYHHTFFEMLGNWSFGDYFKEEAITWAWELLTRVWGLPKERLWVTVFAGDEKDGLRADDEAARLWREKTDVDPAHVLLFGKKDNFWEMGETGPCGPCSEIHIDRGGPDTRAEDGADRAIGVNAGNERFMELWNLVFMEFNRLDDGRLSPLPARHVDTGMGFERIVGVLQGRRSNYDTDVFTPLFAAIAELTGKPYSGGASENDVAFRVVADHVRAVTSAFADGALPSNVGRGYVLRRLIRRASRYGRQALGMEEPFLFRVVPAVAETLGGAFPEIPRRLEHVQLLIQAEEESFAKTLGRGLVRFEELAGRTLGRGRRVLPGDEAYELYATYGFPRDLVELMARERSLSVDEEGFERARARHQEKSRSEGTFKALLSAEKLAGLPPTRSTYHEASADEELETSVAALFRDDAREGADVLVLAASPFYPEAGGQCGDSGVIEALDGSFRFRVDDAQRLGQVVAHVGAAEGRVEPGSAVRATVDRERRARTRKNHTATHLLHKALRHVLGEHVTQQGSYVGPDRLRFDLSHPSAITPEELERIEALVNERVFANAGVRTTVEDLQAARARGVMALFGEKYDDRVRVVDVDGWSTELCGGTHVRAVGDIGPFVIVSESAIQAGVRRIEAVTGPAAVERMQRQRRTLLEVARALKSAPDEVLARVEQLQSQVKEAKKSAAKSALSDVSDALAATLAALKDDGGVRVGFVTLDLPQAALRELGNRLKAEAPDLAAALVGRDGDRLPWLALAQGRARERGDDARKLAELLRRELGGGGGGKPELAQGQGQDRAGLERARTAFERDPRAALQGA